MAWRDQLQPASFRGVPFHVEGDDLSAGRRVQVHEYPQRDKPYVEDLGRATRRFSVTGYIIGADYMAGRDRLLAAVEEAGPGALVHPYYGSLQVVADGECRVAHSDREGGMCRFSLSFVEAGELAFPSARANTASVLEQKADALATVGSTDFAGWFTLDGLPDFVTEGALADLTSAIDLAAAALGLYQAGWSGVARRLLGQVNSLFGRPLTLAQRMMGLFAAFDGTGSGGISGGTYTEADGQVSYTPAPASAEGAYTGPAPRLAALSKVAAYTPPAPSYTVATPARRQQAANSEAVAGLVRRAALVQSARTVAAVDWPVYDDAVQVRDRLADQIDQEASRPSTSDPAFRALTDLRVAVVRDITARSSDSARLRTVRPVTVQPAVMLAYDLYEDAGRDEEIVARNRIRHPGFVPVEPLKVLA